MSVDNILEQLESIDQKLHQSSLNLDSIELQLQQQHTNNNNNNNNNNDVSNASSIEWPAARIRSTFIDFFVHKKHHVMWPSSPVVPVNDPTLLFANAGMVLLRMIIMMMGMVMVIMSMVMVMISMVMVMMSMVMVMLSTVMMGGGEHDNHDDDEMSCGDFSLLMMGT